MRPQLLFLPLTQPGFSGKLSTAEAAVMRPPSGSGRTAHASIKSRDEMRPMSYGGRVSGGGERARKAEGAGWFTAACVTDRTTLVVALMVATFS